MHHSTLLLTAGIRVFVISLMQSPKRFKEPLTRECVHEQHADPLAVCQLKYHHHRLLHMRICEVVDMADKAGRESSVFFFVELLFNS